MGDKITIDMVTGNFYVRQAYNCIFPDKVDERTFTSNVRKTIGQKIRLFYKALREVSPLLKEEKVLYFGPKEKYEVQDRLTENLKEEEVDLAGEIVRKRYLMTEKRHMVEVELTGAAKEGLYWLLYLHLHPASKGVLSIGMQEEFALPLAEQIGAAKGLNRETGGDKKETIEATFDKDINDDVTPFPAKKPETVEATK